jgi:hypothetical protein
MHIERYRNGRFFGLYDDAGILICVCLYRKGAEAVMQRLQAQNGHQPAPPATTGLPVDQLPTDATRRRWRRALAIAAILFETEGYHACFLHEVSRFIAQLPANGTAPTKPRRHDDGDGFCDHCQCWRPSSNGTGTCHVCHQELEPF